MYYTKTEGTSSEVINDKNQTNEILTVDITVDVDDIEKLIEKESSENIEDVYKRQVLNIGKRGCNEID